MMQPSILGPSGNRMVEIGSQNSWLIRSKGDIVASFQWLDIGHESGEPQACMCLFPKHRTADTGTYALPQEDAWRFADNKGNPTPHLMGAAFKYCKATGKFPDKSTIHRVMDVILENLPDLINMPSSQPAELNQAKAIQGIEVSLKKDGKVIHEALV